MGVFWLSVPRNCLMLCGVEADAIMHALAEQGFFLAEQVNSLCLMHDLRAMIVILIKGTLCGGWDGCRGFEVAENYSRGMKIGTRRGGIAATEVVALNTCGESKTHRTAGSEPAGSTDSNSSQHPRLTGRQAAKPREANCNFSQSVHPM